MITPPREGRIGLRMSAEEMADLDEVRRAEPDMPQRSEMLRRLIRRAAAELKAEAKPQKTKPGH
jgi:metal-responsive CopG/Arc/MetJ family transcriptional regulator